MNNLKHSITIVAATSREVLRLVRERLGPDAIILSNRVIDGGVEITAVADHHFDEPVVMSDGLELSMIAEISEAISKISTKDIVQENIRERRFTTPVVDFDAPPAAVIEDELELELSSSTVADPVENEPEVSPPISRPVMVIPPSPTVTRFVSSIEFQPVIEEAPAPAFNTQLTAPVQSQQQVLQEIHSMRGMIEEQIAGLMWNEKQRRDPVRGHLLQLLLGAGFSGGLAKAMLDHLPANSDIDSGTEWVKDQLAQKLPVAEDENSMLDAGGIFALVGPTGVGKTTTTAKLAARCVMRFGAEKLALVTTDSYRIGAFEQLRIYGQILGVSVYSVKDAADLRLVLDELRDKHMILIDTVGKSQRDRSVSDQIAMLCGTGRPVKRLLLLNASSHGDTMNEVVHAYRQLEQGNDLAGCIFTKVDESTHPGALLDTVIRHKLPVHYISTGQRVPENLVLAESRALVQTVFEARSTSSLFVPGEADLQQKSNYQKEKEAAEALLRAQEETAVHVQAAGRLRTKCEKLIDMLAHDVEQLTDQATTLRHRYSAFAMTQKIWRQRYDDAVSVHQIASHISAQLRSDAAAAPGILLAIPGRCTLQAERSGDSYTLHSTLLVNAGNGLPIGAPAWSLSTAGGANSRAIEVKNATHLEKNVATLLAMELSAPLIYLLEQLPGNARVMDYDRRGVLWLARARATQSVQLVEDGRLTSISLTRLANQLEFGVPHAIYFKGHPAVARVAAQKVTVRAASDEAEGLQPVVLECVVERIFDSLGEKLLAQNFLLMSPATHAYCDEISAFALYAHRSGYDAFSRLQKKVMEQLGGCGEPGDMDMLRRLPVMLQLACASAHVVQNSEPWAKEACTYLTRLAAMPVKRVVTDGALSTYTAEGIEKLFGLLDALEDDTTMDDPIDTAVVKTSSGVQS